MSTTAIRKFTGTGSPEGVVTAPPGSVYNQTDATASYEIWHKQSGTGNAGWINQPNVLRVDSISDLKALSVGALASGTTVQVNGYYAADVGGAGLFRYNSSSTATDDGGTIIAPNSGTGRWERVFSGAINVLWFGAKGDGSYDDTTAFQAAFDYCCAKHGKLIIPTAPSYAYSLTSTVTIKPQGSDVTTTIDVEGTGLYFNVLWHGGSNVPVFQVYGLKFSTFKSVNVSLGEASSTGNVIWDADTTSSYGSNSAVDFYSCVVDLAGHVNSIGWRLGHVSAGSADVSYYRWHNCVATADGSYASGQRGWMVEGVNTSALYWYGGSGTQLEKMVTALPDAGSTQTQGASSLFVYGLGGEFNLTDFEFIRGCSYLIAGGHSEGGKVFLSVPSSSNADTAPAITVTGYDISNFTPADGKVVNVLHPCVINWNGGFAWTGTPPYSSSFFYLAGDATRKGTLNLQGATLQAPDPCWSTPNSNWEINVRACTILDTTDYTNTGRFANYSGPQTVAGGVTASGQLAGATGVLNYGASLGYGLAAQASSNVTPVTVNANSTAAQNMMSYSVPAGLLNVLGRSLRLRGAGVYTTQSAQTPTLTLTLTLGGVTIATFGATAATTAATSNVPWSFEVVITTASTGTSGTVEAHGDFRTKLVSTSTTPLNLYPDANTAVSSSINLTTAETLQVAWTFSTNAATANTATQRQMLALLAG